MSEMCVLHCFSYQWRQGKHILKLFIIKLFFICRIVACYCIFSIIWCYCGGDCIGCSILQILQVSRYCFVIFESITGWTMILSMQ